MKLTKEQKDDALKIVYIYAALRKELETIESELTALNERKDTLLKGLESTRVVEAELIDKIRSENPGAKVDVTNLFNILTENDTNTN